MNDANLLNRQIPISRQLSVILKERIGKNYYGKSEHFPSENELAIEFDVSRSTVRASLAELTADKLIIKIPGKGTFINKRVLDIYPVINSFWEYSTFIRESGRKASVQPLKFGMRSANEKESNALGLEPGDEIMELVRLFCADANPVIYSINIIPSAIIIKEIDISSIGIEISQIINDYFDRKLNYVIADIRATIPTEIEIYNKLALLPNTPILLFNEIFYDEEYIPIVYANNYYNDESIRLRLLKKPY